MENNIIEEEITITDEDILLSLKRKLNEYTLEYAEVNKRLKFLERMINKCDKAISICQIDKIESNV